MIKCGVAKFCESDVVFLCKYLESLPFSKSLLTRIKSKKRKEDIASSALSYLLLHKLFLDLDIISTADILPEIIFDGKKPRFLKKTYGKPLPVFNISHSGSICAVVISDEGEVGIDVQEKPQDIMRLTHAIERFKRGKEELISSFVDGFEEKTELEISEFCLSYDNKGDELISSIKFEESLIIRKEISEKELFIWSMLEAYLKAVGCGFSGAKDYSSPLDYIGYSREFLHTGNCYSLSVVKICDSI